ncbi:isoprenylcysteine carboxylmethyltransferase family protein [Niastella caeni]|uniref:Isoprenylcysteine carboxylmethyltransferase family protein n=1 Tax=Niastella caeni TaxID=2569763 RepID=A0A4S8HYL9_9BACT|nr:isoprenylcysteine carboxylmethyltransferase family protein [Niastella caeni]THU40883.1 isoprenylcysteine carboxylmethyltransferase family protein [Niastella caeni]
MESPSILKHLRDIILLPFTVTFIVPYLLYDSKDVVIPHTVTLKLIGWLIAVAGSALFVYTVFLFKMLGQGTLAPWQPTQKLIVEGPYRYCRNPMISGVFFMIVGEGLMLYSTNILAWAVAFFIINTLYFIFVEERSMMQRFGSDYLKYKKHVPRWIPRFTPFRLLNS